MKYVLAKKLFATALNGFYSDVKTFGMDKIPRDKPVLFISNHNNAFIDPLLLASRLDRKVTFTAKSTLADNPVLNLIIKSFSVELLSRKADRSVDQSGRSFNTRAFDRLGEKLNDAGSVYIFPEGKSHNDAVLHEFKTGAARLALAYAKNNTSMDARRDLIIVPLGLSYSSKSTFRSTAGLQVGEPLSLNQWLSDNPNRSACELTHKFKAMVEDSLSIQKSRARTNALTVRAPVLNSSFRERFRHWENRLVATPVGALGWMLNALPLVITAMLVKFLSSDHDHPASAAIVVGPPVFAIVHGLQMVSIAFIVSGFLAAIYLSMLVPSSIIGLNVFDQIRKC